VTQIDQMMSTTTSGTSVSVVYDGFRNRVAKAVNGVTTQYLVESDLNPTGYPQVFDELNSSGVVTRTYTYGLQRISENLNPAFTGNSTWTPSFYGYDGGGNVRQLTNASGSVTDSYEIPGTPPNPWPPRCPALKAAKDAACDLADSIGGCSADMSPSQLASTYAAWVACGAARAQYHKVCWNGGNEGHQKAEAQVWEVVRKCTKLLAGK
jgi:YD repeat-containing protein